MIKMSKVAVVAVVIFVLTLSVRNLAETQDDGSGEEIGRAAYPQGQSQANVYAGGVIPGLAECFVCTDCPRVYENTTYKLCPISNDRGVSQKCVVYSEKYKHMKKPWVIRGCASERGSCADIRSAHKTNEDIVKLLSCYECEGDRCNTNGVPHSLPDLVTSFFVIVIIPILGKFTLS